MSDAGVSVVTTRGLIKEVAMAKVYPYHSSHYDAPHVHHDHDNCPPGSQIPWNYKVSGTGGYRRCGKCVEMD